jgi:hypothetical protein
MTESLFRAVAASEGWSEGTQIGVLLHYIDNQQSDAAFSEFLAGQRSDAELPDAAEPTAHRAERPGALTVHYDISGTYTVPDGSQFVEEMTNLVQLPCGGIVSVHPVIELESHHGADDHRNLNYAEAQALGVTMLDYDRSSSISGGEYD